METVAIENQWIEKFQVISKEENNSSTKITINDLHPRGASNGKYDTERKQMLSEKQRQFLEQRKMRMIRMQPLFASQPRLEIICQNWKNDFVDSGFTTYIFSQQTTESFESREDDLKYMINLCGCNLTELDLYNYPSSRIMPLIKSNCFNLSSLLIRLNEVESKDFDDVFSNMSHLETLIIYWQRDNSSLPMTLVKSLEQVRETLKTLVISCDQEDKLVGLVSSILSPETEALMAVIGNMKNLETATIELDYGVTDELIINLTNNSKNLKFLHVCGSNITDKGLIALNKLNQLEDFSLGLMEMDTENKSITDQSIQCLSNNTIVNLNISNCTQITNSSVIKLVKNLPNLKILQIENTKATVEVVKEVIELKRNSELLLTVWISFKVNNDITEFFTNPTVSFVSSFEE